MRAPLPSTVKRMAVAAIGGAVLVAGLVMLDLPGPGLVVVVAGLAILATEFAWARHRLHQVRTKAATVTRSLPRLRRRNKDNVGSSNR